LPMQRAGEKLQRCRIDESQSWRVRWIYFQKAPKAPKSRFIESVASLDVASA
jgi:hypothetical protein